MNRWFSFALTLCLLLTGCTYVAPEETVLPSTTETVAPSIPETKPSLYISDDPIEKETNGAVTAYRADPDCNTIIFLESQPVLLSNDGYGPSVLTKLDSGNYSILQSTELRGTVSLRSLQLSQTRSGYYSTIYSSIILLDKDLREVLSVQTPGDMAGEPVISTDLRNAYYTSGTEIHVLDLRSGMPRLLRQRDCETITVDAVLFNNSILQCTVVESEKKTYTEFISADTGETVGRDGDLCRLYTWNNSYLLQRVDGIVTETLFGEVGGELKSLSIDEDVQVHSALAIDGVVTVAQTEEDAVLCLYSLTDGLKAAELRLNSLSGIRQITAEPKTKRIWFLAENLDGSTALYCWDTSASQAKDDTVYTGIRYTREMPDTEGIAQCREVANKLQEQYGIEIWLEREKIYSENHAFVHEYQPRAILKGLQALEKALSVFPEDFFETMGTVSGSGQLHVSLVRSLTGRSPVVPQHFGSAQYWINGKSCIAFAVGEDAAQQIYHALSLALDTYIINNSLAYDDWDQWNSSGFQYDENYRDYLTREDAELLTDDQRVFADVIGMTFPREDRASVFASAMMDGNEELFQSEILQAKLKQICKGIREAFGWKRDARSFPWEQYLHESLAYVK